MMTGQASALGARVQIVMLAVIMMTTFTVVHCADLDEQCNGCWREIGKAVWQTVSGHSPQGAEDDVGRPQYVHNSDLVALLLGTKGKQSSQDDLECSACWVIVHRLRRGVSISTELENGSPYFRTSKKAMLNNGWV